MGVISQQERDAAGQPQRLPGSNGEKREGAGEGWYREVMPSRAACSEMVSVVVINTEQEMRGCERTQAGPGKGDKLGAHISHRSSRITPANASPFPASYRLSFLWFLSVSLPICPPCPSRPFSLVDRYWPYKLLFRNFVCWARRRLTKGYLPTPNTEYARVYKSTVSLSWSL